MNGRPLTPPAARGLHSNVTVNLKAKEAVALAAIIEDAFTSDPDAVAAIRKLLAAVDRARTPWQERR